MCKIKTIKLVLLLVALFAAIPVFAQENQTIDIDPDIQLIHLRDSIYVHVCWHHSDDYDRFSSNGMVIIKNGEALMIDTPMDNAN